MEEATLKQAVDNLFISQLDKWGTARDNYAALSGVRVKTVIVGGYPFKVQFNPARIVSTGAKMDKKTITERPCFLCESNRPSVQEGVDCGRYTVLINPFPIFPRHLTIPDKEHLPQTLDGRVEDMVNLARNLPGYTVFYNGARCGASAPDHQHFQAGNSDFLPLWEWIEASRLTQVLTTADGVMSYVKELPIKVFVVDASSPAGASSMIRQLIEKLHTPEGDAEPMINVLARQTNSGRSRLVVIPRRAHRPSFYGSEDESQILVSPASVDLAGVMITPLEKDFERIDSEWLQRIISETCYNDTMMDNVVSKIKTERKMNGVEPVVSVGIVGGNVISGVFDGRFKAGDTEVSGDFTATLNEAGDRFSFMGAADIQEIDIEPVDNGATFTLNDVVIGVDFHWERKETQRFKGGLTLKIVDGKIMAINRVKVEDYLESVISSEMSANASAELLKAHAVISRSWLLAQIDKNRRLDAETTPYCSLVETETERVHWWDREDHDHFDVCADDHCQRYQGITRATTPQVAEAIAATRGEVLTDDEGTLCDARFSKCCGGVFEEFENCWEPVHYSYLEARADTPDEDNFPDLTTEENAQDWILSRPESFCNTDDPEILSQVLNNYDQETTDFYRWKVRLEREEIARLLRERAGIDFGEIKDLVPVARGTSGRLYRLEIVGTKRRMIIGKELEIRHALSPSHLYSSAFVVERVNPDADGIPEAFVLHGAGWGHGVGLCQIGAAVMGAKGYDYRTILSHYFVNALITTLY